MIVVSASATKKHLYDIELDDGTCGQIDKTVWDHSTLKKGSSITDEEWERLCRSSRYHRAYDRALYYLSLRDYGKMEMTNKLVRADFERTVAEQVSEQLCENGLIDDWRYAAMLARDMSERKLYSKRRIAMALKEKGFESDVIDEAVSQIPAEDVQQALELLRKKRYNKMTVSTSRDKLLAMLARYGFSYSASRQALELYEAESENHPEGE